MESIDNKPEGAIPLHWLDDWESRPSTLRWIPQEHLEKTKVVWSRAYERPVTTAEAVEILMNVKQVAEVIQKVKMEGKE